MPEIKHTFQAGKMNKDLDERLIPKGEYRDALNIEVRTSDGSDVGTVQNLYGNIKRLSYNNSKPMNLTVNHQGAESYCVGSVADERNNDLYFFIAAPRVTDVPANLIDVKMYKDLIVRYNTTLQKVFPVFTDVFRIEIPVLNFFQNSVFEDTPDLGDATGYYDYVSYVSDAVINAARVGMTFTAHSPNGSSYLGSSFNSYNLSLNGMSNSIKIREVDKNTNTIYFDRDITGDLTLASYFVLTTIDHDSENKGDNVLKFYRDTDKEPKANITGINVIDNLLFWTDDYSEPKKINLDRLIFPELNSAINPFGYHSDLYINNPSGTADSLVELSEIDSSTSSAYKEEHITVIRRAPRTAPKLIMSKFEKEVGDEEAVSYTATCEFNMFAGTQIVEVAPGDWDTYPALLQPGDLVQLSELGPNFTTQGAIDGTFEAGMTLSFEAQNSSQFVIAQVEEVYPESNIHNVRVISVDDDIEDEMQTWDVSIVQKKPIFETKLGRFAYRYKYQDGEYSPFSPWSELAFIPGRLDYIPKKGYNLGMVNIARRLKVTNFIAPDYQRPDDVVAVDILFKDTVSPNINVVKTIRRGYDEEWNDDLFSNRGDDASGVLDITTEMIHKTLPASQTLRVWDNVPIKAKAQEVTGNRVVYANYEQNYNVPGNIRVIPSVVSDEHSDYADPLYPVKSVKSLRKYKLGVVIGDKYGRETPVIGIGGKVYSSEFNDNYGDVVIEGGALPDSVEVEKRYAHKVNRLQAELNWDDEILNGPDSDWMEYYKYYIKETSNEYYNLVMDRWYPAEDGNIWLSFQSADRNKVDIETYLTLKNSHGSEDPVEEDARYKILAIENEAPRFIKTTNRIIGRETLDTDAGYDLSESTTITVANGPAYGVAFGDYRPEGVLWARIIGESGGEIRYSDWVRVARMNDQSGSIRVVKPFGESGNMEGPAQFGTSVGITIMVEVRDSVEENRPEFEGRFFVKVFKDLTLTNEVLGDYVGQTNWVSVGSFRIGYVASENFNQAVNSDYQGDYSQATENFDATSDDYSDGTSSNYYNGSWSALKPDGTLAHGLTTGWMMARCDSSLENTQEFWDFYWTAEGAGYLSSKAKNKWFIDEAQWVRSQAMSSTAQYSEWPEPALTFTPGQVASEGINTMRLSAIMDVSDAEMMQFANHFMTTGTKFRFRSDPGDNGDGNQVIYQVTGIFGDPWIIGKNFKRNNQGFINDTTGCIECNSEVLHCERATFAVYFSRLDDATKGLNINHWDPRTAVSHDGRTTMFIEVVDTNYDDPQGTTTTTVGNAIWETEPKENVDIDLYYEATDAIPIRLNNSNINSFAPSESKISIYRPTSLVNPVSNDYTYALVDGELYEPLTALPIVKYATRDIVGLGNSDTSADSTRAYPIAIGDKISFTRNNGMVTQAEVIDHWQPITRYNNIQPYEYTPAGSSQPVQYEGEISSYRPSASLVVNNVSVGTTFTISACNTNIFNVAESDLFTAGVDTSGNTLYELSSFTLDIAPGTFTTVNVPGNNLYFQNFQNLNGTVSITVFNSGLNLEGCQQQEFTPGNHTIIFREVTGFYRLDYRSYKSKTILPWFNCYSFGNGLESDRIRDDFNAPTIDNGVRVSTGLEDYRKERRGSGLIWSGIYNSTSGVNRLNEFNMGEAITKDLNPSYGSIQILKGRDTNVLAFCEDKVLKILANKNALFNADGSSNVTASNVVLGNAIGMAGDYGISSNPESLAVDGYRMYFADKQRGKVFRLSQDGLTPISDVGMSTYFRENLKTADRIIGSFDEVKGEYNITLIPKLIYPGNEGQTISFNEKTKGWPSFKSFIPDIGMSINAEYVTSKNGNIWSHHDKTVNANTFYDEDLVPSTIDVVFNEDPGSIKGFTSVNYEGTQARIQQFNYEGITGFDAEEQSLGYMQDGEYYNLSGKNGWFVEEFETDLQKCSVIEFKEKEGKWFSFIDGLPTTLENLDTGEFTVQGIGIPGTIAIESVVGCMDPNAVNYNPDATTNMYSSQVLYECEYNTLGCTDPDAYNYDPFATIDNGTCIPKVIGCMNPNASNYLEAANVPCDPSGDDWWDGWVENTVTGDCCTFPVETVFGCKDNGFMSIANGDDFDSPYPGISANEYCESCSDHLQSMCSYSIPGCMNSLATNYNPLATVDDGSCNVEVYGCMDDDYVEYNVNATASCADGIAALLTTDEMCSECQTLKVYGCLDEAANNYGLDAEGNPGANTADNSICTYTIPGCTDPTAVNYSSYANFDDGSCQYYVAPIIYGCMDEAALNYVANATEDDGSCVYPEEISGCMQTWAANYNVNATVDDGSCYIEVYGCTNPLSSNYNPNATLPINNHPDFWSINWLDQDETLPALTLTDEEVFAAEAYGINAFTLGAIPAEFCIEPVYGCQDPLATNYNADADYPCEPDCCIYPEPPFDVEINEEGSECDGPDC